MKFALLFFLAIFAAADTEPADTKVPVELSNDYFAADARAAHLKEMYVAAAADLETSLAAISGFCANQSGTPTVDPKNQKRFICTPKK